MSRWHRGWGDVRATAEAMRYNPDPDRKPDLRSERFAAAAMGLLVLAGAIGTYFAVVGGLGPVFGGPPPGSGEHTPAPAVVRTPGPTPGPPPGR